MDMNNHQLKSAPEPATLMYEELIQRLKNAAGGPEGIRMAHDAAEVIAAFRSENAELRSAISHMEAERDAAVELVGKLERCLLFISTEPEYWGASMVVQRTIKFAEEALAQWRGAQEA